MTSQISPEACPARRAIILSADARGVISAPERSMAVKRSWSGAPICSRGWSRIYACIEVSTVPGRYTLAVTPVPSSSGEQSDARSGLREAKRDPAADPAARSCDQSRSAVEA